MVARNREQREAAGMAADGRSLSRLPQRATSHPISRAFRVLSAWFAGPILVLGAVTLNSALADQHPAPHATTPHFSAPHASTPHYSAPHDSVTRMPSQHGYGGPAHAGAPQPFRGFRAAPSPGSHGVAPSYRAPSYGNPAFGHQRDFATERAFAGQPARPFPPANQGYPNQNNANRGYPGARPPGGQPGNPQGNGEHLGSWMRQHQSQSPADQERALRQEQGFNRLAPQQQQNLVNRLHQLDQMPPQQRERTLQRVENMERLSPERRQAVRSSAQQLGMLPQDRKRMVQKAFRDLRDMPPEQRNAVMNSPQFAGQFSAQERSIMGNLLTVEPYQHNGPNPAQQQYGK